MGFSERLNQFIKSKKLKKKDLPERWEVGRTTLFSYLKGESAPNVPFLATLKADFPELNMDWLITGIGEMEIYKKNNMSIVGNGNIQAGGKLNGNNTISIDNMNVIEAVPEYGNGLVNINRVIRILEDYVSPKIIDEIREKLMP